MNEVNLLTTVQQRNVIKLLGGCVKGLEKLLVYEYLQILALKNLCMVCEDSWTFEHIQNDKVENSYEFLCMDDCTGSQNQEHLKWCVACITV